MNDVTNSPQVGSELGKRRAVRRKQKKASAVPTVEVPLAPAAAAAAAAPAQAPAAEVELAPAAAAGPARRGEQSHDRRLGAGLLALGACVGIAAVLSTSAPSSGTSVPPSLAIGADASVADVLGAMAQTDDAGLQLSGCAALRTLADGGAADVATEPGAELLASGGVAAVVAAMRSHAGDAAVLAEGARALHILARVVYRSTAQMAEAGAVQTIVAALAAHPSEPEVAQWSAAALRNLAFSDAVERQIGAAGGIPLLASAIREHSTNAAVVSAGALSLPSVRAARAVRLCLTSRAWRAQAPRRCTRCPSRPGTSSRPTRQASPRRYWRSCGRGWTCRRRRGLALPG